LLRYLSDGYRALSTSVPDSARTEGFDDITEWLGALVRQVDSSLLDEWEALAAGAAADVATVRPQSHEPESLTANVRAFTVLVRNAMFRRVELAALRRFDELGAMDEEAGWDESRWRDAIDSYFAEYERLPIDADARNPALLQIEPGVAWNVRQVFDDPEGDHDWGIRARIELAESDAAGEPVVTVVDVGPL
jgi:hypothetical protein